MKIFTAHYWTAKAASPGFVPVRTSLGRPRNGPLAGVVETCMSVAPDGWMLALGDDKEAYEEAYRAKLERIGVNIIWAELTEISARNGGGDVVLLCFENLAKPGCWCHRRMFAEWWMDNTGEEVEEIGSPPARPARGKAAAGSVAPEHAQASLF